MPWTKCQYCNVTLSVRGMFRHIEVKHPEHAVNMKHQFIIKLTKAQRTDLNKRCAEYNVTYSSTITPQEYVVAYLEAREMIRPA